MLLATRLVGDLLRPEKKRLKGFEPSTFCMASRACTARSAQISPANTGVLRAGDRYAIARLSPRVHGGLGTQRAPGTEPRPRTKRARSCTARGRHDCVARRRCRASAIAPVGLTSVGENLVQVVLQATRQPDQPTSPSHARPQLAKRPRTGRSGRGATPRRAQPANRGSGSRRDGPRCPERGSPLATPLRSSGPWGLRRRSGRRPSPRGHRG